MTRPAGSQLCPQCGNVACSGKLLGHYEHVHRPWEYHYGWPCLLPDHDCTELVNRMRRAMDDDVDGGQDG